MTPIQAIPKRTWWVPSRFYPYSQRNKIPAVKIEAKVTSLTGMSGTQPAEYTILVPSLDGCVDGRREEAQKYFYIAF